MTIVQLEYLLAIVGSGSFSAAAERCFVTQPSLSAQIKNLEDELGVVLIDRTHKPLILTQAGEIVVERAKQLLAERQYIYEDIASLQGVMSGELRLGVIPTIAPYLLPLILQNFEVACPDVELKIRELTTAEIVRLLENDELDVAILSGGTTPESCTEEELFDDPFYVYLSPLHHLSERSNIRVEDLNPVEMLLLSEGHCLRNQVLEFCQSDKEKVHPSYYFESGSLETLMRVVDRTEFMTIVPQMALEFIAEEHRSQVKTLARGAISRRIALATRRIYTKERIIAALKDCILKIRI